jgi:hypothetical protein
MGPIYGGAASVDGIKGEPDEPAQTEVGDEAAVEVQLAEAAEDAEDPDLNLDDIVAMESRITLAKERLFVGPCPCGGSCIDTPERMSWLRGEWVNGDVQSANLQAIELWTSL